MEQMELSPANRRSVMTACPVSRDVWFRAMVEGTPGPRLHRSGSGITDTG